MISLIMSMLIQTNVTLNVTDTEIIRFYVNESLLSKDTITNQPIEITIEEEYYDDQIEVYEQIDDVQTRLILDWTYENNLYKAVYVPMRNQAFQLFVQIPNQQINKTSYKIIYDTIKPKLTMTLDGVKVDELPNYITKQSKIEFEMIDENLDTSRVHMKLEKDNHILYESNESSIEYIFDQDGIYTVMGSAKDDAGNLFTFEKVIQVDLSIPNVQIYINQESIQAQTSIYYDDVCIEFFVDDQNFNDQQSKILVNNESVDSKWELYEDKWLNTFILKQEMDYQIQYEIVDDANHIVKGMFYVQLDKSSPKVQLKINNHIVQKLDKVYKENVDLQLMIEEANLDLDNSFIKINNEKIALVKDNNSYVVQTNLTDGIYTLQYYFVDLGGHSIQFESVQFMIDTVAPKVKISTTLPQAITNERVRFKVDIDEEHIDILKSKFWIEKNNKKMMLPLQQIEQGLYQIVFDTEEEGSYRFHLDIYDTAGNQATYYLNNEELSVWKDILFQIDKTKPSIQIKAAERNIAQSQRISVLLCDDDIDWEHVQILVYKDKKQVDYQLQRKDNKATLILSEEGEYELKIQAYDIAGNQAIVFYDQYVLEDNLSFVIDRQSPTISYHLSNPVISKERQDVSIEVLDKHLKEYNVEVFRNHTRYLYQDGLHSSNWNFSFIENKYQEADYEIVIHAIDYAGNIKKETFMFTIDHAPYNTKVMLNEKTIEDDGIYYLNHGANLMIELQDSHEKEVILEVEKDGDVQRIPIKGSTYRWMQEIMEHHEDVYHIKLITLDQANNRSEIKFTLILDRNLPTIQWVNTISNGAILSNAWIPMLRGEQEDFYVISWSLWKNQKLVKYRWHEAIQEEGYYTLQVMIQDKARNINTLAYPLQFEIDYTPPNVQIRFKDDVYELVETSIPKKEMVIEIVQNDPLKKEEEYFTNVMVNGKNVLTSEKQSQVYVMPNGKNLNIYVEAIDQAGNKINKQWNFKVNQTQSIIRKQKYVNQNKFMYQYIVGCIVICIIFIFIMKRVKKHAV